MQQSVRQIKRVYFTILALNWLAVGLGLMVMTLLYDYRHLEKLGYPLYLLECLRIRDDEASGLIAAGLGFLLVAHWIQWGPF